MTSIASSKTVCVVPGCGNDSNSGWSFFNVPMAKTTVFKKWTKFMVLSGNRTERICTSHFEETDFNHHSRIMLRHNAVPTVRLPVYEPFYRTTGSCCVWGCKTKDSSLLNPFPSNHYYRDRWMDILKIPKDTGMSWMRVCQRHFIAKDFVTVKSTYLKPGAVPSKRVKRIVQKPRKPSRAAEVSGSAQPNKPKSHRICSVYMCTARSGNGTVLHGFPAKTDPRYKIWIHNLKQAKTPTHNYKVCSNHFTQSDYIPGTNCLLSSAVPSVNLPSGTDFEQRDNPYKVPRSSYRRTKPNENLDSPSADHSIPASPPLQAAESPTSNVGSSQHVDDQLPATIDAYEQDVDDPVGSSELDSTHANICSSEKVSVAVCEVEPKRKPRVANFFSDLLINDHAVNVWTGVETLELLEQICISTKLVEDGVYPNKHTMHCADRVILVLCKLKQNISFSALAVLFRVHISTVSRYFSFTSHVLAQVLSSFIEFTPKEEILQNIPLCFRGRFSNVTLILDCTEVPLCTMSCLNCRISTYSQYKSKHTAKFLVGVTPAGLISFCGKAYSGKSSDKFIFNQERVIDLLTPHIDEVMCDKGFSIDNELSAKGITLHIPPFLRGPKLTPAEAEVNEAIAKARIHVERIMGRLKMFSVLCDTIEHCIVGHLDDAMTIICALVNLSKPILKDDKF